MKNNFCQKVLFFLIVSLLLISCGAQTVPLPAESIPDWYLQPAKYVSSELLYGAGAAELLESARKRALQNMSYNLQLQVQTSSVSQTSSQRNSNNQVTSSSSLVENIVLNTKKLTFIKVTDYKIAQIGSQYYAVLTTSYADNITDNKNKLNKNTAALKDTLTSLANKTLLQKITIFSAAEQSFLASLNYLENLEVLKIASKNALILPVYLQENVSFLRKYKTAENKLKSQIVFKIEGVKQWDTTKNLLANHLQSRGYKVGDNYNSIVRVSGKEAQHLLFNGKIKQAKLQILIELKEPNNTVLASREFALQATSLQTKQEASRKAQVSLERQLSGLNIFELLGL